MIGSTSDGSARHLSGDDDGATVGFPMIVPALACSFVTAVSLVLPWITIGSAPARSSIDLVGSMNALEIAGAGVRLLIVVAWLLIPVAIAAALLLGAAGRVKIAAGVVLAVSLLVLVAAAAIMSNGVVGLGWGGMLGALFSLGAATTAGLAMRS